MYCSWAVEYRDSQRWALSRGQTGMKEINPCKQGATASSPAGESPWELEPRLPVPAEQGSGMACPDSLERPLSPHLLAGLM